MERWPDMQNGKKLILPASFDDSGDQSSVREFAEAESGKLELSQETSGTTCELATIAQTNRGRVFGKFVQGDLSGLALFIALVLVENNRFVLLALVPLKFHKALTFLLSCNR